MCEVLDRVEAKGMEKGMEKGIQKGVDETRLENIKSIMTGLKYTADQAMDLLKIPAGDQARYLKML